MPITDFTFSKFKHTKSADQDDREHKYPAHHRVIIAGAGPSGFTLALELAKQGIRSLIIDCDDTVSFGSRAICYSQRTLDILNRLGPGKQLSKKGVSWNIGKVFFEDKQVFNYKLLGDGNYEMPAFINLQQYYLEALLLEHCQKNDLIEIRWQESVVSCEPKQNRVEIEVKTPIGPYKLNCDYLIAADGASSTIRSYLGLEMVGQEFADNFLICDIKIEDTKKQFANQRCYWFNPPFHPSGSTLLHRQPDKVYRIDFQLSPDADPVVEKKIENISKRLDSMLGPIKWNLEWSSVYRFRCRRLPSFIHKNRVIFLGDSAHQVSPFGARGANGAIASAENLGWKLARVLNKTAGKKLLLSYSKERGEAADENINQSTMSALFISPESMSTKAMRNKILTLSAKMSSVGAMINSGRLSTACNYTTASVLLDAPIQTRQTKGKKKKWLLGQIGNCFSLIMIKPKKSQKSIELKIKNYVKKQKDLNCLFISPSDTIAIERLKLRPNQILLSRPDQYLAMRLDAFDASKISAKINDILAL